MHIEETLYVTRNLTNPRDNLEIPDAVYQHEGWRGRIFKKEEIRHHQPGNRTTISRHYSDHEVTTPLPNYKLAQGECEGRLLNKPLNEYYDDFTQKNPDIKVSRSAYCKLRPQHVVSNRNHPFIQCLCEYCINVKNAYPYFRFLLIQRSYLCSERRKIIVVTALSNGPRFLLWRNLTS